MSFRLQHLNVVRIVETEEEAKMLISKGFQHIAQEAKEVITQDDLFSSLSFPDLKAKARELGVDFSRTTKKEELMALLKGRL